MTIHVDAHDTKGRLGAERRRRFASCCGARPGLWAEFLFFVMFFHGFWGGGAGFAGFFLVVVRRKVGSVAMMLRFCG